MDQVPAPSTFDRARGKRIVQKLAQTVRNEDTQELLPLGEVTRRLRVFEQGYAELLDLVKVHGYNLMQERGQLLSPDEVAADWYDRVYLPVTEVVRREELQSLIPDATEGDLYLRVHQHGLSLVPEHGQLGIPDMVRAVKDAERDRRRRLRRADPPSAGKSRLR